MAQPAPLVHRLRRLRRRAASLPFIGAVEAHLLRGFKELGLAPGELRAAVAQLRRDTGDEYALATECDRWREPSGQYGAVPGRAAVGAAATGRARLPV